MDESGLQIELFQSLTQPILLGGVPRGFAIFNFSLALIICLPLQLPEFGLPLALVTHSTAAWFVKKDPYFFTVLVRHVKQPSYWQ